MNKPVESAAFVLASLVAVTGCIDDPSITDEELGMAEAAVAVPACAANTWCVEATPAGAVTLHDVWAADANNVFAVGDAGTILQFDGTTWRPMNSSSTANLRAVLGQQRDQPLRCRRQRHCPSLLAVSARVCEGHRRPGGRPCGGRVGSGTLVL